jgi:hypothetical protein
MTFMNYLVFLDPYAGELEKILSGTKSMVVKEFDLTQPAACQVKPGDSLYFLRNNDECNLRVKATVVRVLFLANSPDEGLSLTLKEMQSRLQFTEEQYNYWLSKKQVLLVEFDSAQKIDLIHVALNQAMDRSDWISFEEFSLITK